MFRRLTGPGIETLTAPSSLEAFADRQATAIDTIHTLGLREGDAVIIGSAALAAAYGLDAHMESAGTPTFDVDAVVSEQAFRRLQGTSGAQSQPVSSPIVVHIPRTESTLPVSGIRTPLSEGLAIHLRAETFSDLSARATNVKGIPVLSPADLANAKVGRGDTKDYAGIIKAHTIAWEMEHPIASDPDWQQAVLGARNALEMRLAYKRSVRRELPEWLVRLTASHFDHPAFTPLHFDFDFRRAS